MEVTTAEEVLNQRLIDEREAASEDLFRDVLEINQVFQDISLLINQQGEKITDIESATTKAMENTADTQSELHKADKYQKSAASKRNKILAATTVAAAAAVTLVTLKEK